MSWRKGKRVAIIGAGPGGVSTALAMLQQGYDVRLFERQQQPKALGGAVLLSVPVLAVLRHYGIDISHFGSYTSVVFKNNKGKVRAALSFNPQVEKAFNIKGWHYGVLRASAFGKMLAHLPAGIVVGNSSFNHYEAHRDGVTLHFDSGATVDADILVGADGIKSKVSAQAFGDPGLFHVGLRIWLAWCEELNGLPSDEGVIAHSKKYQASYFPMLHDGKPGFEWWIVEPSKEHAPQPANVEAHVRNILGEFCDPLPRFAEVTNFDNQIFCWDVYNRPSLKRWSNGRVVCVGDAVHPVSPYAAYGMGMAIEDGYFLAKFLAGRDLNSMDVVSHGFSQYERERVAYVNHNVEFARKLGGIFHCQPNPVAKLRDVVFDHTGLLNRMIQRDYLADQEAMCLSMKELHVSG